MSRMRFKVTYYYKDEQMPRYAFFKTLTLAKDFRENKSKDHHYHDFFIKKIKLK